MESAKIVKKDLHRTAQDSIYCCARRCLSQQTDFNNQPEWLREVVEVEHGHKILFFPKFHCELNFIEMVYVGLH
jgi:hypothetical protein